MDDNVIQFPKEFHTVGDLNPEDVLSGIQENNLDTVVILGWDKDGEEYFASSTSNGMEILWLMERLKHKLMQVSDE